MVVYMFPVENKCTHQEYVNIFKPTFVDCIEHFKGIIDIIDFNMYKFD